MRVIPTRIHGVLDYLMGVIFIVLPKVLDWNQTANYFISILGVSVIVYSLLTRYELGAVKWIPMSVHLILDLLGGILLIVAPFILRVAGNGVTTWMIVLGLVELIATLMTRTESSVAQATGTGDIGVYDANRR